VALRFFDFLRRPRNLREQTPPQHAGKMTAAAALADVEGFGLAPAGTFDTYRKMRGNPTIAMARIAAHAPIRSATFSFVTADDGSDELREWVEEKVRPLWPVLLRDLLYALDYGFMAFEKVWRVDEDGKLVYDRLKPLLVDKTVILVDEKTGAYRGLRQGAVVLPPEKTFLFTYDGEAGDLYGRSRHENVREAWHRWNKLAERQEKYIRKVSGVTPMVEYPPGRSLDASGAEQDNYDLAVAVLENLGRGQGVAMPNVLASYAEDLVRQGIDISQLRAWQIEFLEPKSSHGSEFVEMMRHLETQLCRGWLIPERAVQEGQHGTLAEAEAHARLSLVVAELLLRDIARAVNDYVIAPLLAVNFGQERAKEVALEPQGLDAANQAFFRDLLSKVIGAPQNVDLFLDLLDVDALLDMADLPRQRSASEVEPPPPAEKGGEGAEPGGNGDGAVRPETIEDRMAIRAARRSLLRSIYDSELWRGLRANATRSDDRG